MLYWLRKIAVATLVMAILASAIPPFPSAYADPGPTLSLSPSTGPVDTAVSVTASDFAVSSFLAVTFDGVVLTTAPAVVQSDTGGNATFAVSIPTSTAGPHVILGNDGANSAAATFTVQPKVTITSPASKQGPVGTSVTVRGTGFNSGATALVLFEEGNLTLAEGVLVDASGSFTSTAVIPPIPSGLHTVWAIDSAGGTTWTESYANNDIFTATPSLVLNPTSGLAGSTVVLSGSGWYPYPGNVTVAFAGSMWAVVAVDELGQISASFQIPSASTPGIKQVLATDALSQTASTYFTVTGNVVTFSDPNLEAAIREAIGKPSGDIYQSDLGNLTSLYAGGRGIGNLSGLEYCSSLTRLDLSGNQIGDILPLSGLTNLQDLALQQNQIVNVSALGNLTNLQYLYLNNNQVSNISPLASLTNLQQLNLNYNQVSNISPLVSLINLQTLDLTDNQVSDISPISSLTNLQYLYLTDNQVSDISAISSLTTLQYLYLWQNQVADISALGNLTSLIGLYLELNQVSDISALGNLTNLEQLSLYANQVSDISALVNNSGLGSGDVVNLTNNPLSSSSIITYIPLLEARGATVYYTDIVVTFPDPNLEAAIRSAINKPSGDIYQSDLADLTYLDAENLNIGNLSGIEYCSNLDWLYLDQNQISDISPLSGLTNLSTLILAENQISDISPLSGLIYLNNLNLASNRINDISPLSGLTNLTMLNLSANQISDIPQLPGLAMLRQLDLSANKISDISSLSNLTLLLDLNLNQNQIIDISPLSGLTSLQYLDLTGNQVSDISALVNLTNLQYLYLTGNQVSDISAISSLTNLQYLYLWQNQVSDISALGNLTTLLGLYLEYNQVSEISALGNLTNLERLSLYANQVSDISALVNLTNLQQLSLFGNQVNDISPLVNNSGLGSGDVVDLTNNPLSLTSLVTYIPQLQARGVTVSYTDTVITFPDPNLEAAIRDAIGKPSGDIYQSDLGDLTSLDARGQSIGNLSGLEYCSNLQQLMLGDNQISDVSPLASLTSLQLLGLNHNQISDITALGNLTDLRELHLFGNPIGDITALGNLTKLQMLRLDYTLVDNITPLAIMTNLQYLDLSRTKITDISALQNLTNLSMLDIGDNEIADITPLQGLVNLDTLRLGNNQIGNISALSTLTNLISLNVAQNHISDLSPLSGLTKLAFLYAGENQVSDVTALQNLTNLKELSLNNNSISNLIPLVNLTHLANLYLPGNQISDIGPLVQNSDNGGLGNGDRVSLWDNPLSNISISTYMSQLRQRGVWVGWTSLSLAPSSGPVGTVVELYCGGLHPGGVIPVGALTIGGGPWNTQTIIIDVNGEIRGMQLVIPPTLPLGNAEVVATDSNGVRAMGNFTLTPSLVVTPTSGLAGSIVTLTGSRWYPGNITVTFAGPMWAVVTADESGQISASLQIPWGNTPQVIQIVATDTLGHTASTYFTVSAQISGFVYEADGTTPIPGCRVYAENYFTGITISDIYTAQDGSYSLLLPLGAYKVRANPTNAGLHYVDEWYDNIHEKEVTYQTDEQILQLATATFYSDVHAGWIGNLTTADDVANSATFDDNGWGANGTTTTAGHYYPTAIALISNHVLTLSASQTDPEQPGNPLILGLRGDAATTGEIISHAIWMGLLVNGGGSHISNNPDEVITDRWNVSVLPAEWDLYLNQMPASASFINGYPGTGQSGSYTWVVGQSGVVFGAYQAADGNWYAGYNKEQATILYVTESVNIPDINFSLSSTTFSAEAGTYQICDEGDTVNFTGTISGMGNDTINWDFGDGYTFEGNLAASHRYLDNGVYTVTLTVTDQEDKAAQDTTVVIVRNVAPSVEAGGNQTVNVGDTVIFSGSFTDPGNDTHTIEWYFGDASAASGSLTTSHVYSSPGVYTVTLVVIDDDGGKTSDTLRVIAGEPSLSVEAGYDQVVTEGSEVYFSASFNDPYQSGSHTIEWDFGDGHTASGNSTPTHVYSDNGVYTVTLSVTSSTGHMGFDILTITGENVPPQVEAGNNQVADVDSIVSFNGSFSDPGQLDSHTIEWDFGDGSSTAGTLSPTHSYSNEGIYSVTLKVTDDDAGVGEDTVTIYVPLGMIVLVSPYEVPAPSDAQQVPLSEIPLKNIPIDKIPLQYLQYIQLKDVSLETTPLQHIPLQYIPLQHINWNELLQGTSFEGTPIQYITLGDLLQAGIDLRGISLADIFLAGVSAQDVTIGATPLQYITLHDIPIETPIQYIPGVFFSTWEDVISELGDGSLTDIPLQYVSLRDLILHAVPLQYIPLQYIKIAGTPLQYIPLQYIPLSSGISWETILDGTVFQGYNLADVTLGDLVENNIDLKGITLEDILITDTPIQYIPLQYITLEDIPVQGTPLQYIPLQYIGNADFWTPILQGTAWENKDIAQYTLGDLSLASTPIQYIPLQYIRLQDMPLQYIPLENTPLQYIPLQYIGDINFWNSKVPDWNNYNINLETATLEDLALAGIPLQYITIQDIQLASIPLQYIPLQYIDIVGTPLQYIPLQYIGDINFWTQRVPNWNSYNIDLTTATLEDLALAGAPLQYITLKDVILAGLPLQYIPLQYISLQDINIEGTPLQYIPLQYIGDINFWTQRVPNWNSYNIDLTTATLEDLALAGAPLQYITLNDLPVTGTPLQYIPLQYISLQDIKIVGTPLQYIPLQYIGDINFWRTKVPNWDSYNIDLATATLGDLTLACVPLQYITLQDALLAATPLQYITLADIPIEGTPLQYIPLQYIGDINFWRTTVPSWDSYSIDLATATLVDIARADVPLQYIPLQYILLDNLPLQYIPLQYITLEDIPVQGTPLQYIPLQYIGNADFWTPILQGTIFWDNDPSTLQEVIESTTLGDLAQAGIPLQYITLQQALMAFIPLQYILLDTPLQYIPLQYIGNADFWAPILQGTIFWDSDPSTLQQVIESITLGDLVRAGIPLQYITLWDALLALIPLQHIPWESIPLEDIPIQDIMASPNTVTYTIEVANYGDIYAADVSITHTLPDGFKYVAGSSSGVTTAEPTIDGQNLTWQGLNIPADTILELEFKVISAIPMGTYSSTVTVTSSTVQIPGAQNAAPIVVIDPFEPNNAWDKAQEIVEDRLYLSCISSETDVDWYKIPVPVEKGTVVTVYLSHLPEDYDLIMFADTEELSTYMARQEIPLQDVPLEDIPLQYIPPEDTPTLDTPLREIALQDIPFVDMSLQDISIERGTLDETTSDKVQYETGYYYILISGYNGAHSNEPYMLRVSVTPPLPVTENHRTLETPGPQGTAYGNWGADTKTLIVTNQQRLKQYYGDQAELLLERLKAFADMSNVKGMIMPLEQFEDIYASYSAWDKNTTDPEAANRVSAYIKTTINGTLNSYPNIEYVVIVGSDEIVPFRRVPDEVSVSNESNYASEAHLNEGSALYAALAHGYILTDDYYVDTAPVPWMERELYVPDYPIGRLVETPEQIMAMLNEFESNGGLLIATTALVTGYDFLSDAAERIVNVLASYGFNPEEIETLINETWTAEDLANLLLSDPAYDLNSINAHCNHWAAGPPIGEPFRSEQILTSYLGGKLVFSTGCHAGLNVDDLYVSKSGDWYLDLPEALAQVSAWFVGNTGYGYGDTDTVALSEKLMSNFAEALGSAESVPVGQALMDAKQKYFLNMGSYGPYDEKIMIESTLYGLPMYEISMRPSGISTSSIVQSGGASNALTIEASRWINFGYAGSLSHEVNLTAISTANGEFYGADGETQFTIYRPIQPRTSFDIGYPNQIAHGALFRGGDYIDSTAFDPVIGHPLYDQNQDDQTAYEPQFINEAWYPSKLQTLMSLVTQDEPLQNLVVTPGQFITTKVDTKVEGTERLYSSLNYDIYYSTSQDYRPPTIEQVEVTANRTAADFTAYFSVNAHDDNDPAIIDDGIVKRVVVTWTYSINGTAWETIDLAYDPASGTWVGELHGLSGNGIDFIVQAVDNAGNVGISTNKGVLYSFDVYAIEAGPDQTVNEADTVYFSASFTDQGAAIHDIFWDFGDGSTATGTLTPTHVYTVNGIFTVTLDVTLDDGSIRLDILVVNVNNVTPNVEAGNDDTINEGETFFGSGCFTDPGADTWAATVDYGDGSGMQLLPLNPDKSFNLSHTYIDNGTYTVTVNIEDASGGIGTDSLVINTQNTSPTVGIITAPVGPVQVKTNINASASFSDPGLSDTHTALWDWGDGSTSLGNVNETSGSGSVSGSHTYLVAGVYTVKLIVTDDDGSLGQSVYLYIVAYDPGGGFVTGGGWINSPIGAYTPSPSLSGKATFGFVSKYQKGANVPTGQTQFQFHVANMDFKSTNYQWLVIAGARAQYKGSGTINGTGDYYFILTAIDGQITGGGGVDKFRIKIWDNATSTIIYDNNIGAPDTADPSTSIAGGSIVIHK